MKTCEDSSRVLARDARLELLKSASQDWTAAKANATQAAQLEVKALNLLRNCGLKLSEAAGGKTSITFEFLRLNREHLPADLTFNAVKFCVHLSRFFENPIQNFEEARIARRPLFEAFALESAPKRIEQQSAIEANPWNDFVSAASSFTSLFGKLDCDAMESWGKDKLSTFARETGPIAKLHEKAVSLLR